MPAGSPKNPTNPPFLKEGERAETILGYGVPDDEHGLLKIFLSLDDHSEWYEARQSDILYHEAVSSDALAPTVFFLKEQASVLFKRFGTVAQHRQFLQGEAEQELPGPDSPRIPYFTYVTPRCLKQDLPRRRPSGE